MIIAIQMDNGLSSFIEIDEMLLDVMEEPLAFAVNEMIPHLNECIKRRAEKQDKPQ